VPNFQRNLDLVEGVEHIARRTQCTPAQLALAWLLAQGDDMVPIPGTKQRRYLEQDVGARDVAALFFQVSSGVGNSLHDAADFLIAGGTFFAGNIRLRDDSHEPAVLVYHWHSAHQTGHHDLTHNLDFILRTTGDG
jgi:hypothetical protein